MNYLLLGIGNYCANGNGNDSDVAAWVFGIVFVISVTARILHALAGGDDDKK